MRSKHILVAGAALLMLSIFASVITLATISQSKVAKFTKVDIYNKDLQLNNTYPQDNTIRYNDRYVYINELSYRVDSITDWHDVKDIHWLEDKQVFVPIDKKGVCLFESDSHVYMYHNN